MVRERRGDAKHNAAGCGDPLIREFRFAFLSPHVSYAKYAESLDLGGRYTRAWGDARADSG